MPTCAAIWPHAAATASSSATPSSKSPPPPPPCIAPSWAAPPELTHHVSLWYNRRMQDTRPHVAISAHLLVPRGAAGYRSAGIHTYIANLLQHLPEVDETFRY